MTVRNFLTDLIKVRECRIRKKLSYVDEREGSEITLPRVIPIITGGIVISVLCKKSEV